METLKNLLNGNIAKFYNHLNMIFSAKKQSSMKLEDTENNFIEIYQSEKDTSKPKSEPLSLNGEMDEWNLDEW